MFEMFISAIPSFVLSLQPNNNRVKGKFIPYVLSRAIPGALTMALGVLTLYILHRSDLAVRFGLLDNSGAETLAYQAMMMLVLTFGGLVMLFRICQPFNVFRTCIFALSTFLCVAVVSVPYLGEFVFDGWTNVDFTLNQVLLLIIIIQASFPLSSVFIRVFDMMNPADE